MKKEITKSQFIDEFKNWDTYKNNFSYIALSSLYDYLEEYEESTDTPYTLDVVALCCEFTEYDDLDDYLNDYKTDIDREDFEEDEEEEYRQAILEEIEEKTQVIYCYDYKGDKLDSFIIQAY